MSSNFRIHCPVKTEFTVQKKRIAHLKLFPSEIIGLTVQAVAMAFLALLPFIDRGTEKHPLKRPLFTFCAVGGILLWIGMTVWGLYS